MYSEKGNVLQLAALLKAHGITHIVCSPGSRNSPLIHSFATDSSFTCYSIVDERSAGFFALGVAQAINKPVAVCCTSGTAALNLGSSVAEAFYQQLPLLVITADRPAAWIGQMDGQTIPQPNMFREITRCSVNLPQINGQEDEWHCNRLINEAILGLNNRVKGPVHINIPLGEPLFGFNAATLPPARVIRRSSAGYTINEEDGYADRFGRYSKRMIVVGQLPPSHGLNGLLASLREKSGTVVLSEHISNIRIKETSAFDTLLYAASEDELNELTPELVITIGGHIVSKRLKLFLRSRDIREHWHVSPSGEVADTFCRVTDIVGSDEETFLRYLNGADTGNTNGAFHDLWQRLCASIEEPRTDFSDLSATGAFMRALPEDCSLQLANSSSVRLAQYFGIDPSIHVFCNRGTSGIDGSLSTAAGYAATSDRLTFLLIGDLSFFYDMNGLWNRHKRRNLRILLNNNAGGEIFHILPGLNKSEALDEYIAASHNTEAKAWAEQQGFLYLSARDEEELRKHLPAFTAADSERPVLLEVFTTIEQNAAQLRTYYHQQKNKQQEYGKQRMDNY